MMWQMGWPSAQMNYPNQFGTGEMTHQQPQAQLPAQNQFEQMQMAQLKEQNSMLKQQLALQAQTHIQHLSQLIPPHQPSPPIPQQPTPAHPPVPAPEPPTVATPQTTSPNVDTTELMKQVKEVMVTTMKAITKSLRLQPRLKLLDTLLHQLHISHHRANRFLHSYHPRQPDTAPGLTNLVPHPENWTNVQSQFIAAHAIVDLIETGHPNHLHAHQHREGEVPHDVEVQVLQSQYDPHLPDGEKGHPHGMMMISNLLLHITPIHGNHQSHLLPIHTSLHILMIHHHPNMPLPGNRGQHGTTGATPTTLHSQRDNGRTTRSPTVNPTKRANGSTTPNHHTLTIPHMTLPPVQLRHFPLNLLIAIAIPNAINEDPDPLNPDSPHSPQGMYLWIYMAAASLDGKQL